LVNGVREADVFTEQPALLHRLERVTLAVETTDVDLVRRRLARRLQSRHDPKRRVVVAEPDVRARVSLQDGLRELEALLCGEQLDRLIRDNLNIAARRLDAVHAAL